MAKQDNAFGCAVRAAACKNEKSNIFVGQAEAYKDVIDILKDKKLFKELYKEAKKIKWVSTKECFDKLFPKDKED